MSSGVKQALSFGQSSRDSGSCSGDNGSQDLSQSSFFVPLPHGTMGSSRYLAHDDVPVATDGDDISIRTSEEMEKYESLRRQEFAHTRVYNVYLRGLVWMKRFPPSSEPSVGENSTMRLV
jgi:hypothetical protein